MARLNITIPDELYERVDKWRERLNLSRICQEAIGRELDRLEQVPVEVREMHEALLRLGQQKAKIEQSCFRKGVYDGLEWARQAEYPSLRHWGERTYSAEVLKEVLDGPVAQAVSGDSESTVLELQSYAEGWITGVSQFWERVKNLL